MVIVIIVSILALLGTYSVRKYVTASKTSEATEMITMIKGAEESYKDETFAYLRISPMTSYFPFSSLPKGVKMSWDGGSGGELALWNQLGVHPSTIVQFGYACDAEGATIPDKGTLKISQDLNYPASAAHWFVVRAASDRDGNGIAATFVGSSFTDQIYGENETE